MQRKKLTLSATVLILPLLLIAQTRHTISGTIRDSASGETLIGASIILLERTHSAVLSNAYGFYSLSAPAGNYRLLVSFAGYRSDTIPITLDHDRSLAIQLAPGSPQLQEVVVTGNRNTTKIGRAHV